MYTHNISYMYVYHWCTHIIHFVTEVTNPSIGLLCTAIGSPGTKKQHTSHNHSLTHTSTYNTKVGACTHRHVLMKAHSHSANTHGTQPLSETRSRTMSVLCYMCSGQESFSITQRHECTYGTHTPSDPPTYIRNTAFSTNST